MKPSYLGVIELKRTRELNKPVKIVQLTQFENEADAYKYLAKFPDNQIIAPTVKAAMHIMEKWKIQGDTVKVYSKFSRVNDDQIVLHSDWISQVFLCVFSEDLRIFRVFDKDTIFAACQKLRNKEKARKATLSTLPTASYKKQPPQSKHHLPYQKRKQYRCVGYHSPKNGKYRAKDYPRQYFFDFDEETGADIAYHITMPKREFYAWDDHWSEKYWSRNGHICWKNDKKNKKQWMKHIA